jgi:hypothetical protein
VPTHCAIHTVASGAADSQAFGGGPSPARRPASLLATAQQLWIWLHLLLNLPHDGYTGLLQYRELPHHG